MLGFYSCRIRRVLSCLYNVPGRQDRAPGPQRILGFRSAVYERGDGEKNDGTIHNNHEIILD